jgi:NitT/TauT family transport system substrate-binding protein
VRREPSKLSFEAIHAIIDDEKMLYCTPAPTGVMAYADHMVRSGQLKNKLASWKDAFFDNAHAPDGK